MGRTVKLTKNLGDNVWMGLQFIFIKYKLKFSHGDDKEWTYEMVSISGFKSKRDAIENHMEYITARYQDPQHWRGYTYKVVKTPPKDWMQRQYNAIGGKIKYLTILRSGYRKLLDQEE